MKQVCVFITALALAGLASSAWAAERTQSFAVAKMDCPVCPVTVTLAIKKLDGVTDVIVNFDAKTATVTFDDAVTSSSAIAAASTNAGYPATPLQTGST